MNTTGLFHRPAAITNQSTTVGFLEFGPNNVYENVTTGGVINTFPDGRQQMAFFIEAGNFSTTSAVLNHMWVQWGYRGLYPGYRRINLGTQGELFPERAVVPSGRLLL